MKRLAVLAAILVPVRGSVRLKNLPCGRCCGGSRSEQMLLTKIHLFWLTFGSLPHLLIANYSA